MSVWNGMVVGPRSSSRVNTEHLLALVRGLILKDLVAAPYSIVEGELGVFPFNFWSFLPRGVGKYGSIAITYQDHNLAKLLNLVETSLTQHTDFCVCFSGYNWRNDALRTSFERHGFYNADVLIYSFVTPRAIDIQTYDFTAGNPPRATPKQYNISLSQYFCSSGSNGPEFVHDTPLEEILMTCFGPDMQVHCSSG